MKVILFVDDENLIIRNLKNIFDDNMYEYVFKNSGVDALEYIKAHPVDLLCTDIIMPDMDGFQLLDYVKKHYPKIMRIALTDIGHPNLVRKLSLENLAQLHVFKPWNDTDLKANIIKIMKMQTALHTEEMMKMLQALDSLPTLPDIYETLVEMVSMDAPVDDIAALIEEDQSTASVILRVANSAYYGRKTGSIHQAVMNIGLNNLKSIIIANSVFEELTDDMGMLMDMWQHSTLVNKLVTAIYSECLKKPIPGIFASAGLLHDIGKVVLYHNYEDYRNIIDLASETGISINEYEKVLFGVTHQDLGAYLLNLWGLPFAYVESSMHHDKPMDHRIINKELVAVVHLANYYANCYRREEEYSADLKVYTFLKLEKDHVEKMLCDEFKWRIHDKANNNS
ncbi:response regulator [Acidaminobacter sp. JC074]|uniref:response regulator n=1 Tax=Acidaminobacter sp. JC074 TaxID=2530199 RepID=UPI001F1109E1|nr:response regulator [Acidaminobacter sp. JC074]MCH4886926.1 response regulator [Acidaminobacter sp. JC074]